MLWRRYTLLCVLALTSLPLMIIGWTGRESLYSEYEFSPLTEPGLALVMEGIHDGVYPWQSFIKPKEKQEAEEPEEEDIEEASAAEAVTSESGNPAVEYAEAEDSTVETVESIPANAIRGGTDAIPVQHGHGRDLCQNRDLFQIGIRRSNLFQRCFVYRRFKDCRTVRVWKS